MELKQLKALVTVAEVGSVTRAAELLHLVQPAVTRQIRLLEQELEVDLFERTHKGMRPTPAGDALVQRARRALNELERARSEARPTPGVVTGIVNVGLLESTIDVVAERLVTSLAHTHPGVELRLLTAYSGHLQQWLDQGDLDLSLLYNLSDLPSLNTSPVIEEELWVVAPASAGLNPREPVPFLRLGEHPLVMPASGHALRSLVDTGAARSGTTMRVATQTNSMRLQKHLVMAGHGWTVLPGVGIADDVAAGTLSAAPLCEPDITRSIALAMPRSGRTTPAIEVVAQGLHTQIREAVADGRWPRHACKQNRPETSCRQARACRSGIEASRISISQIESLPQTMDNSRSRLPVRTRTTVWPNTCPRELHPLRRSGQQEPLLGRTRPVHLLIASNPMAHDAPGLSDHVRGWAPEPRTQHDIVRTETTSAVAAMLDLPTNTASPGEGLPPLWQWFAFLDWPPGAELGPDGHPAHGRFFPPLPDRQRMIAGGQSTILDPLIVGETAEQTSSLHSVREKQGRTGALLFVTQRHEFRQHGRLRVVEERDVVYRSGTPRSRIPSPAETPNRSIQHEAPWVRRLQPDSRLLFRFSALTANTHRIHYDAPYCREVEHHRDLVVHGPLLVVLMLELVRRQAPERNVASLSYRLHHPVYVDSHVSILGFPSATGADLQIATDERPDHATARVTFT